MVKSKEQERLENAVLKMELNSNYGTIPYKLELMGLYGSIPITQKHFYLYDETLSENIEKMGKDIINKMNEKIGE
jgi:hypothetical protein